VGGRAKKGATSGHKTKDPLVSRTLGNCQAEAISEQEAIEACRHSTDFQGRIK